MCIDKKWSILCYKQYYLDVSKPQGEGSSKGTVITLANTSSFKKEEDLHDKTASTIGAIYIKCIFMYI